MTRTRDVLASPPVGPIADALAAMKEPKAAPLIASHLLDPQDTDDDVKRAAAALAALGTKDELGSLKQFFAMYRATAESEDLALAVASVGCWAAFGKNAKSYAQEGGKTGSSLIGLLKCQLKPVLNCDAADRSEAESDDVTGRTDTFSTASAYPASLGASFGFVPEYVHAPHAKPP